MSHWRLEVSCGLDGHTRSMPLHDQLPEEKKRHHDKFLTIFASWKSDNGLLARSAHRYFGVSPPDPENITCAHLCTKLGVSQDLQDPLSPTGII